MDAHIPHAPKAKAIRGDPRSGYISDQGSGNDLPGSGLSKCPSCEGRRIRRRGKESDRIAAGKELLANLPKPMSVLRCFPSKREEMRSPLDPVEIEFAGRLSAGLAGREPEQGIGTLGRTAEQRAHDPIEKRK